MAVSRRTGRSRYTLVILVLTSITIITLDFRGQGSGVISTLRSAALEVFAPIQSAADAVFSPIGDVVNGVIHYGDLEEENERLRAQLEDARGGTLRAADAERERDALSELLDLDVVGDIPSVPARVVATASSNFELTIEIDRGSDHGVAEGMPVVTGGGLVGRVTEVSASRAVVLLVTDPRFNVGVRFTGSGDVGIATGAGRRNDLDVDMVGVKTKVKRGEVIVTSGLQQSVFPPGIPVGTVVRSTVSPGALQRAVTIEPGADLDRLAFVRVLQWSPTTGAGGG